MVERSAVSATVNKTSIFLLHIMHKFSFSLFHSSAVNIIIDENESSKINDKKRQVHLCYGIKLFNFIYCCRSTYHKLTSGGHLHDVAKTNQVSGERERRRW